MKFQNKLERVAEYLPIGEVPGYLAVTAPLRNTDDLTSTFQWMTILLYLAMKCIWVHIMYYVLSIFSINFTWICVARAIKEWFNKQESTLNMRLEIREQKLDELMVEIANEMKYCNFPSGTEEDVEMIIKILEE